MKKDIKPSKSKLCYFIGGVAFAGAMIVLIPEIIERGSNYIYRVKPKKEIIDSDDWGPEIVKTNTLHGN